MSIERIQRGIYRFYKLDSGIELPSVTCVLGLLPKPKIVLWAVIQTIKFLVSKNNLSKATVSEGFSFHKTLLNSLAEEGTNIHNIIEDYLVKKKESSHNSLDRFKKFEIQKGFKIEEVEKVVWDTSCDYNSAGTADLIGSCFGINIVLDIKTSKAIRLSHKIQSCIYRDMYEKNTGKSNYQSGVLLIPRDSKSKWELYINSPEDELIFRKIYSLLTKLFKLLLDIKELDLT